jgi:hypothetical protein
VEKFKLMVVTYVAMFALAASSILYTTISQHNTEQKFCNIITTVNDAYKDAKYQPTTDLGQRLKESYAELEADLNCSRP